MRFLALSNMSVPHGLLGVLTWTAASVTVLLAPSISSAQGSPAPATPQTVVNGDNAGAEWVGFENSTAKDRENELRSLVGQFRRVTAEGDFFDLCRSIDRKSTRLNSSHLGISYAVFCL